MSKLKPSQLRECGWSYRELLEAEKIIKKLLPVAKARYERDRAKKPHMGQYGLVGFTKHGKPIYQI